MEDDSIEVGRRFLTDLLRYFDSEWNEAKEAGDKERIAHLVEWRGRTKREIGSIEFKFEELYPDWEYPRTETGFVESYPSPEQALEVAELLSGHEGAWVTYRDTHELALPEAYSNHLTPLAIYGLDAQRTKLQAEGFAQCKSSQRHNSMFYNLGFTRRPIGVVFKPLGRIISEESYLEIESDWSRIRSFVDSYYPEVSEKAEKIDPARWQHRLQGPWHQFITLIHSTENLVNSICGAAEMGDSGYKMHPDKPALWRTLFQAAGIDALVDRGARITGDCGPQVLVFDPTKVEIIMSFENPASPAVANIRKAKVVTGPKMG